MRVVFDVDVDIGVLPRVPGGARLEGVVALELAVGVDRFDAPQASLDVGGYVLVGCVPGGGVCGVLQELVGDVLTGGVVVPAAVSVVDDELEVGAHGQGVDADQGGLDVGDGVEAGHDEVAGRVEEVVGVGVGQDPPSVVDGVDGLLPAGPLDVAPPVDDVAGDQAAPGVLR